MPPQTKKNLHNFAQKAKERRTPKNEICRIGRQSAAIPSREA